MFVCPLPVTTSLALPCANGERCSCLSCTSGVGSCIRNHKDKVASALDRFHRGVTDPAFTEPATPPVCVTPIGNGTLPIQGQPLVPSSPCGDECRIGPPAVLLGDECHQQLRECLKLPSKGTRGCILLSPQRIVAPVGGEVILMSGICGTDGYLAVGEPLEWMLTPDSVGTFIEVGNDDPGTLHRLANIEKADKVSPSFARGVTSTKKALITRGNLNPNDDVPLDKGQTWLSLSSPSEGVSRVTVLAPESDCWDQRKATATIYWIDARWQFPTPQPVLAGTPVTLSTRVTRSEGSLPARGWTVRYEMLNPELGLFANGKTIMEATVDGSGNATVEIIPARGPQGNFMSGTAIVQANVVRPNGVNNDNMPDLPLGSGQIFVTWSAPQLAIRAGAPSVAPFDSPVEVVASVQNPGDQPATNVRVQVALPPGVRVTQADSFAQRTPTTVTWEIGTIPPQQQIDLFMTVAAQSPVRLNFVGRGDQSLYAEAAVAIDVFRPSLTINVKPSSTEPTQVGDPVTFDIDVTNTGDRPLTNVELRSTGDSGMTHSQTGSRVVGQKRTEGPLQPGQTWTAASTFIPLESGRRCVTVRATADGGQQASAESCATVLNRIVPVPAVTAKISAPESMATGDTRLFRFNVSNSGQVPLRNVKIIATFDPQLQLVRATEGNDQSRLGQFQIAWNIPEMRPAPDATANVTLEAEFTATQPNPRSTMILTVASLEGARVEDKADLQIVQGAAPEPPAAPRPNLPPVQPTPNVPAPVPGIPADPRAGTNAPAAPGGPAANPNSGASGGSLALTLLDRDDPVRVGQPIRYSLSVRNNSNQFDGNVGIRFRLPEGVSINRVAQRAAPSGAGFQREGDMIRLDDIRDIRPGETIDFDIELVGNQPQDLEIVVEAISRLMPTSTFASQRTRVIP